MEEWADQVMTRTQLDKYLNSSSRQGNKKMRKKSVLLLDSSDFGLVGKYHTQKTNKLWSYKLNGPGRKYQLLTDVNGVFQLKYGVASLQNFMMDIGYQLNEIGAQRD